MFSRSEVHRGGIYGIDGSSPEDMVVLLQKYGVQSQLTTGNTMQALEQYLAGGHKVIAGVNAETIWGYPPGQAQRTNADHAVVVTGVDTRAEIVHLNDSGTPTAATSRSPWPPSPRLGRPATTCSSSPRKPVTDDARRRPFC